MLMNKISTIWQFEIEPLYFSNNEIGNLCFVNDFIPQNPVFFKITLD